MQNTDSVIEQELAVIKAGLVKLQIIHELLKTEWHPGAPYELSYIDYPLACIKRYIELVDHCASEQIAAEQGIAAICEVIESLSRNAERPFFRTRHAQRIDALFGELFAAKAKLMGLQNPN